MIKRRLTPALASIGLAGGLLVGTAGAPRVDGLIPVLKIKEISGTDIVQALTSAAIPGPTQLPDTASAIAPDEDSRYYVKIDNTGDGYEDVAYRWEW
jgi:hypothetical protein